MDQGHAAIVTYLTYQLAKIHKLSPEQQEVAVLAAILHDTGWSTIENIADVFSKSITGGNVENEKALRILHQERSVAIARELLAGYPDLERVVSIISHHDTRELPKEVDLVTACMWDADILWRLTSRGLEAGSMQLGQPLEKVVARHDKFLTLDRKALHLPASLEIGKLEKDRALADSNR